MKLLNNFVALGYAALYSEALALGAKAGITPKTFDAVIGGGRMDCGFYQTFFQWVIGRDPNAHRFAIRNGLKDLSYLAAFANAAGAANPLGAAVRNAFAVATATGHGDEYVPRLADITAGLNGVSLIEDQA
jgi:3-hydroxyisobutyrate dehydrogenase-like beta-hydroxyacid dehydrogenase